MTRDPIEEYGISIIVAVIMITLIAVTSSSNETKTKVAELVDETFKTQETQK